MHGTVSYFWHNLSGFSNLREEDVKTTADHFVRGTSALGSHDGRRTDGEWFALIERIALA